MTEMSAGSTNGGALSIDGQDPDTSPATVDSVGADNVTDQFSAVINIHACNLQQIEAALMANAHQVDPHPAQPGMYVKRHPIYLACFDPSKLDADGQPAPGEPVDLDAETTRRIFANRYSYVSPDPPPADGSHIQVAGMHTIAELDSNGVPTGRVRLGNSDEVQS